MFRIGRNPSNAGAFLLWASLSTATLIVQIICDLYQEAAPEFPLPPLLLQSVISVVAASGLVIASGRRSYPNSFHYYQPFVGGDTFTAMQILGYLSVASGVLINIGFWKVQHTSTFRGVLSCAGVLMVFGNVMLMSSLDHYKTKCDARLSTSPAAGSVSPKRPTAPQSKNIAAEATQQHLRHPPPLKLNTASPPQLPFLASPANRTMLLVIVMCILGNTAPAAIATMVPSVADLVMSVQLVLHVLAALLVHVVIGCRHTPEYRLFMPVPRGSFKLAFTQGFAWFTFSLGLQGSLFVIRTGKTVDFFFHLIYAVSITSAVSIFSLLLFVRMWPFHKRASVTNDRGGRSPVEQEASPLQLNPARSYRTGTTEYFIVHHGRFTASFVAVLGSLFVISISYVRLYPDHIREYVSTDFFVSSTAVEGMRVCQLVTILFLLALPPLTHSIGALVFPGEFDLWAPFTGSKVYIALQALGWTVHTLSVICAVAVMSTGPESAVVFACLLSFSQLFIHASLHVFEPSEASFDSRPLSPRRGPQSPRSSSTVLRTLNGELMLSVVLAVGGLTLRFLAYLSDVLPRDPLLWFATLSLVLAAPLAHLSIRFRNGPLLSPFQGPPEFVALQAVGWTLYTLSLVLEGIRFAEGRGFDTQHSWTIESLMYLVPYSMVAFSAVLWKGETTEEPGRVVLSPTRRRSAFDDRVPAASEDSWKSTTIHESMMYHAKQLLDELSRDNAAQDRFPELQHQLSLFVRQRGKEQGPQTRSNSPGNSPSSSKSFSPSHGPLRIAGITVATLSISEVLLYVLAALYSTDSHRGATAVVLTVSGMICATLTSFSVHLIVGPLVYPDTYHRFMPFSGGGSFVVLQACGWGAYSASMCIGLAFLLTKQQTLFALPLAAAGLLGAAGQFLVYKSVGLFAAAERSAASNAAPSLLEVHAEGSVAVLLFLATFTLHHIHENVSTFVNDAIGPVVVLVSTTSVMLALPLSAVALRKTRRPASSPKLLDDNVMNIASLENESSLDATPTKKKQAKATNKHRPSNAGADRHGASNEDKSDDSTMEYFVIPIMTSFPVALLYVGYFTLNHYTVYATMVLQGVLYGFYALMALIVVLIVSRSSAFGHSLKELRKTLMTWILYMIPTIIVLPSYLVPLLFPCRSTMLWAVIITLFTIIPPPFNRKILRPVLGAYTGYWGYELVSGHSEFLGAVFASCSTTNNVADESWLTILRVVFGTSCTSATIAFLTDFLIPVFWFVYGFTFSGAPEEKGKRRSPRFVSFFKRHFFDEACKYFSLRVVAEPSMRGRLNNPDEKFIFGFHPHGVFPATAMYIHETDQWKAILGSNSKTLVTTHGATILFNGPLLRDFVMALGGRSVTRRAIETSQNEGNSVIVVLGGQAEMLLTGCSTEELHIVTHHLGLIRLALRQNIPLVPIVVLGEHNILDTLHYYNLQKWFLKRIGFPFPLLPMGRGNLPLPMRASLLVAVGNPVYPPVGVLADDPAAVESFAETYFKEVTRLFDARKVEGGFPNIKLFLHHGLPSVDPRSQPKPTHTAPEPPKQKSAKK